ncbi:thiamine pyrophosphate-dependent dehydrogenase E1 component subunit alpha [Microbulbifer agarilyticus]|uniref:thiamine pyrophosphate-dependent dehydrogenase E1 component subunit alpha n=1 Tax=Microbulbifer agarilyticus TaxID=260552 RepID=UPI001CD2FA59|nr:thiamine pyrophosphate-dependent dehydrogenase E1 component subunit alpha [Microbulbifer agarilyticus]MCA0900546.1 thiamine pyrophosphate-dependent dehydrogenase E1 component subunit alpha [Microbulbifer agarilyticus]
MSLDTQEITKPKASTAGMSKQQFLKAYRTMRTIRDFEAKISEQFMKGNIPGFLHLYSGQEAVAAGLCLLLEDDDYVISTHRGHGHCIAKGGDVGGMMKEIMAKQGGLCDGKGGSMHIADFDKGMLGANAIVGGGPPIIVGAALSAKTLGTDRVGVAFGGDGSSNQGTTFEAMNLAVVLKLPAIFLFENNGYGEGTHASYAVGSKDIASRAQGFGMPAYKVDGTDLFAVYEVCKQVVEHCRQGKGPVTIEANVPRFKGHFEGDPQAYRGDGEIERLMKDEDCLVIARKAAIKNKLASAKELDAIDEEIASYINEVTEAALAAPAPGDEELLTNVYSSAY